MNVPARRALHRRQPSLRVLLLAAMTGLSGAAPSAQAAELLMFEQAGCPFCRAFDREIAPDYPFSAAGAVAPLRRVDIYEDRRGGIAGLSPAVFTPTFVVVDDAGHEVGRLEGYPGRRYFYPEIEAITARLRAADAGTVPLPSHEAPGLHGGTTPAIAR